MSKDSQTDNKCLKVIKFHSLRDALHATCEKLQKRVNQTRVCQCPLTLTAIIILHNLYAFYSILALRERIVCSLETTHKRLSSTEINCMTVIVYCECPSEQFHIAGKQYFL